MGTDGAYAPGYTSLPPSEKHVSNRENLPVEDDAPEEDSDDVDKDYDDEDDYLSDEDDYRGRIREIPDEEKTPVSVVTGFLGAGKTTLVNYILREQVSESRLHLIQSSLT